MPETPLRGGAAHWIIDALPRIGRAGSRSASLHRGTESPLAFRVDHRELRRFTWLRWLGTLGAILVLVGGVGAGATPVVGNVFWETPVGSMLGRMLISSTIVTFTGIGMLIAAWLGVGAFVASGARTRVTSVDTGMLVRTFAAWVIPLIFTAPLFTQDIYSYLAQGAVVDRGMDPYAAGPVELLGTEDPLARSVPLIWADSPSPYGPTAMVVAWAIAAVTDDAVLPSVFLHRAVSVASLYVVAWALVRLAQRCGVSPQFALWLGVLNPLTLLHLVGGVHNEALLLAFLLSGMELCLVALHGKPIPGTPDDPVEPRSPALSRNGWLLFAAGVALIAMAGMVKVTGFVALGFVGMALARRFGFTTMAVARAAAVTAATAAATIVAFCLASGLGFGWITSQGGAATVRSWMSLPTLLGISSGFAGRVLGIGDVSEAALSLTRGLGILLAAAWLLRMLWATFRGRIHPLGGYGLAMFAMVLLFPVVHPWYLLWALVPLSGWADRSQFRVAVVAYSAIFSLTVLPRGLGLPPGTVLQIYLGSIAAFVASMAIILAIAWRTKVFRLR
ncbi:alpha 1,6 mannopyranosyltransferase [Corynebacterium xerosis]|uniref:Alpha 1,6 mannopyranosyltransferase n=1 Tax=Corynebacterium xerosis TaxID=1725 RepID=A0A2N6T1I7_9CORY|nr:polyprenol phosphomannose-dependent alpha 1,6 mannosyltransferase MptB [Corynebacterium xerosis]AYJ32382.1 alpha 1,6 mannopyranosyltransferase [Corynebacterium xerosis]PMC63165.1 alpha 1,6 mannopyranosyltransferase [Corynebacterium xerosis]HJG57235.1 polyprenol phosphomannose-dependent alpha 1,6 mannosyltransferase MptB [Corynebacterium xerosis]